jgi:hypothetical protein
MTTKQEMTGHSKGCQDLKRAVVPQKKKKKKVGWKLGCLVGNHLLLRDFPPQGI